MATTTHPSASEQPTTLPWVVLAPLFALMVLDGFDTISLGLTLPALAADWRLRPADFTAPLVMTNAGVVLGYLACGWLAARVHRRDVVLGGAIIFAAGSALTAVSTTMTHLTWVRLLTGFGLGVVLPAAISLATTQSPARRRHTVTVLMTMGLSVGAAVGGFTGRLLVVHGWPTVFWVGTVVPLLLVPVVAVTLRRTARAEAPAEDRAPGESRSLVLSLFRGSLATSTTLLWAFAFLIFTTYYAFNSWLPTLLLENGFSRTAAPIAGAALGIGGILGGLLLVAFSTRVRVATILVGSTVVALAFMFLIGTGVVAGRQVLPVFGGVALGLVAGMAGQAALAVSLYPERARTTGVGWAAALGRLGSIAGPAIGGALLASGTSARSIVVFACLPVALAAVVVATLDRRLTPSHAGPRPAFTETQ